MITAYIVKRSFTSFILVLVLSFSFPMAAFADTLAESDTTNTSTPTQIDPAPTSSQAATEPNTPVPSNPDQQTNDTSTDAATNNSSETAAVSGDVSVSNNTNTGNATSGNATATTNTVNVIQSSTGLTGDNLTTFNQDLHGDITGDLLIDPGQLGSTGANQTQTGKLQVNVNNSQQINNDITVSATSGNTSSSNNTNTGNLASGDAHAVANVVNVMNSAIASGRSFVGTINIHGNFDGDILLPKGFLDSLLASNASRTNTDTNIQTTDNQSISNNINVSSASGTATIANNTSVGNVSSGSALSNLTVLNLTRSNVVGTNNLFVFVNVLGKWYGVIMDAPSGTTAASVGGGISSNTFSNADINATTDTKINNNINVHAKSGDITAANNTNVGNVSTGNASSSVNLLNFINSHVSLSDWFGILFINVFGTWNGSFGVNTAAGGPDGPDTPTSTNETPPQVFSFAAKGATPKKSLAKVASFNSSASATLQDNDVRPVYVTDTEVLGDETIVDSPDTLAQTGVSKKSTLPYPVIGASLGALIIAGERAVNNYRQRRRG